MQKYELQVDIQVWTI